MPVVRKYVCPNIFSSLLWALIRSSPILHSEAESDSDKDDTDRAVAARDMARRDPRSPDEARGRRRRRGEGEGGEQGEGQEEEDKEEDEEEREGLTTY